MRKPLLITLFLPCAAALTSAAHPALAAYEQVSAIFAKEAQELPGPVYKYSWPRTDLKVTVNGIAIAPGLALGSWAAFAPFKDKSRVMGDLVLLQSELGPVVEKLAAGAIDIMAIHNHLIGENPRVIYVHYMGEGEPADLARTLRRALEQTRTPLQAANKRAPQGRQSPPAWTSSIESALGRKGKLSGQVYAVSVARADVSKVGGATMPSAMGFETALNFQKVGAEVASAGDFVLTGSEVNPVIRTLQSHRIAATALHNHMLNDHPRLFFLHYWALGDASQVAAGLKAALARMSVKQP